LERAHHTRLPLPLLPSGPDGVRGAPLAGPQLRLTLSALFESASPAAAARGSGPGAGQNPRVDAMLMAPHGAPSQDRLRNRARRRRRPTRRQARRRGGGDGRARGRYRGALQSWPWDLCAPRGSHRRGGRSGFVAGRVRASLLRQVPPAEFPGCARSGHPRSPRFGGRRPRRASPRRRGALRAAGGSGARCAEAPRAVSPRASR